MQKASGFFGRNDDPGRDPRLAALKPASTPNGGAGTINHVAAAKGEVVAARETAPPDASDVIGNRLIVGPDVKLKGAEINDCDTLVVEGRVEATLDSRIIRIAEKGCFSGTVNIDTAEIHGLFDGELTARSQLFIHAGGRVSGKIRYGTIRIEEGGQISGDVQAIGAGDGRLLSAAKPGPEATTL